MHTDPDYRVHTVSAWCSEKDAFTIGYNFVHFGFFIEKVPLCLVYYELIKADKWNEKYYATSLGSLFVMDAGKLW